MADFRRLLLLSIPNIGLNMPQSPQPHQLRGSQAAGQHLGRARASDAAASASRLWEPSILQHNILKEAGQTLKAAASPVGNHSTPVYNQYSVTGMPPAGGGISSSGAVAITAQRRNRTCKG